MPVLADPEFEVEAVITSSDTGKTGTILNVHNLTFIKSPFNKLANTVSITVESDYAFLAVIASEAKSQLEPTCKISIYNLENTPSKKFPNRLKRSTLLFSNDYFVYLAIEEQAMQEMDDQKQLQDQSRIYTFILANPILHWLNTNHGYVSLLDGMSADDAISDYESYLKSKFSGGAFSFQHVTTDINKHVYEQILIRATSDLEVVTSLMLNYKAYDSISYYYFDDFAIGSVVGNNMLTSLAGQNNRAINNIALSLGSVLALPKVDILDANHKDSLMHVSVDSVESSSDMFLKFQKHASTVAVETADAHIHMVEPIEIGDVHPIVSSGAIKSQSHSISSVGVGRTVHGKSVSGGFKKTIPQHHTVLYGPDSAFGARVRFSNSQKLITNSIKSYLDVTFQQCYPDLLNLTSMYNLDTSARSRFAYLPIGISNIFHKQNAKEIRLTHSIKAKFMEFNI